MVSWAKDANSRIWMALIYVSILILCKNLNPTHDKFFSASSERLRMAASVRTAGSSVTFGVIVIIVGTAIGAVVFTRKRTRARMRHIEQIRSVIKQCVPNAKPNHHNLGGKQQNHVK